jgi:hypothetical protein
MNDIMNVCMIPFLVCLCDCSAAGAVTISSAALNQSKQPLITASLISPVNVKAGTGVMHNINQVLLPTTNITRLLQIANCSNVV